MRFLQTSLVERLNREEKLMSNPIVHVEVVGKDAEALQGFYRDAFDWQMLPSGPDYAMAHPGVEGGIDGGVGASPEGGEGHVTFYVEVGDLEAALGEIESLGGNRVAGPMDVPDGPRIAMFADPEVHVVGLIEAGSRRS
jgi:predicted enzyme related to lactoylglutathione lyase